MDRYHGDHSFHPYGRHARAMVWMILYGDVGRRDVFWTIPTHVMSKRWVLKERARTYLHVKLFSEHSPHPQPMWWKETKSGLANQASYSVVFWQPKPVSFSSSNIYWMFFVSGMVHWSKMSWGSVCSTWVPMTISLFMQTLYQQHYLLTYSLLYQAHIQRHGSCTTYLGK